MDWSVIIVKRRSYRAALLAGIAVTLVCSLNIRELLEEAECPEADATVMEFPEKPAGLQEEYEMKQQATEVQAETMHGVNLVGSMDWDADEAYLLARIAMAEAEGEDTEGKALVILVVLNRVWSDEFPNTIEEVILQESNGVHQFSVTEDGGRWWLVEPSGDCWAALDLVATGWDESQGALYFESSEDPTWHSRNLEFLFKEGKHKFYR